jgi:hypothetical protein
MRNRRKAPPHCRMPQVAARSRLSLEELPELASLAQTAEVMGLTVDQVRTLVQNGRLEYVPIGCRQFVPKTAIPRFIANNTVQPCRDETPAPVSASSKAELFLYLLD